ncbi:hypothetical protein OXX69_009883 [Metschnikowia pulcherrima]
MIATLLLFVAIAAAVRPSLERNSKISVSRYDHPHSVAIDPKQNPFLAFFPAPTTMVESEHCTSISVPRAIDSFVWEITGHYKAEWTGVHTFRMDSTQKATIQLGLFPVGVQGPENGFDEPTYDFTTLQRSYPLREGAYYPLKIVYIAGKKRVPVKVSTENGWQDINSQIKHVIYHYQKPGLTRIEPPVEEYSEPGFHFKAFLFPVHADPELAISTYERLDLAQEGKFDENFSELAFDSIIAPNIVEVTGQIVVDEDGAYSLTVSGQVFAVVHVGPGAEQKEKYFFMDKDWQQLDTRVRNIAKFAFAAGLYYPYRIAVISDRKDTEWEVKAFNSAGTEVDLFGIWGSQVPEEPARPSRQNRAVNENGYPSPAEVSGEYFSCKSNFMSREREDGVQDISPIKKDPETDDAAHAILSRINSEEKESTAFFTDTSALGAEGGSKSIQDEDYGHGESSHDFSSYHPEIDSDDISDSSTEYNNISYSPLTQIGPTMDELLSCDDTFSLEDLCTDDEMLAFEERSRRLDTGFYSRNQNSANLSRMKASFDESDSNTESVIEVSSEVVDGKDDELSHEIQELSALQSTLAHERSHDSMGLGDDADDVISVPSQAASSSVFSDISPENELSGDRSEEPPVVQYASPESSPSSVNNSHLSSVTTEPEMTPSELSDIGGPNETITSEPSYSQLATDAPKPHFDEITEIAQDEDDGTQSPSEDVSDRLNSLSVTSEDTESLGEMSSSYSRDGSSTPESKQSSGLKNEHSPRKSRVQFSRIPSPTFKNEKYPQRGAILPEPKNVSSVTPSNERITIDSADTSGGNEPQAPSPAPRKSLSFGQTFILGEKPAKNEEKPNALDRPDLSTRPQNYNRMVQAKKANVMSQQSSPPKPRWQYVGSGLRQGAIPKHNGLGTAEKQRYRSRYVNPNHNPSFSVGEAQKSHLSRGRNSAPKPEEGPKRDWHWKSGMQYQQIKPGDPENVQLPPVMNTKPTPLPRKFVNTQKSVASGVLGRDSDMNKAPVVAKQQAFATPTQRDSHSSAAKSLSRRSPVLSNDQDNLQTSSISSLSSESDRAISTYDGAGFKVRPSDVIGMRGLVVVLLAYMV